MVNEKRRTRNSTKMAVKSMFAGKVVSVLEPLTLLQGGPINAPAWMTLLNRNPLLNPARRQAYRDALRRGLAA